MKSEPFKRVGSPASFRGIRGGYLTLMLMYVGGGLFFILILLIIPFPTFIRMLLILSSVGFIFYKYNVLKNASKGDLNISNKENCRKSLVIKSKSAPKNENGKHR